MEQNMNRLSQNGGATERICARSLLGMRRSSALALYNWYCSWSRNRTADVRIRVKRKSIYAILVTLLKTRDVYVTYVVQLSYKHTDVYKLSSKFCKCCIQRSYIRTQSLVASTPVQTVEVAHYQSTCCCLTSGLASSSRADLGRLSRLDGSHKLPSECWNWSACISDREENSCSTTWRSVILNKLF
jgi:hypothetical protein